ncbi:hypothetical protein M885DRAFT_568315 [Pelagophyceae sp. CCMP2097]|nr:hypothetical protein M885DRAFT_568315 [Pelagophyceae sp. CCMP2097]
MSWLRLALVHAAVVRGLLLSPRARPSRVIAWAADAETLLEEATRLRREIAEGEAELASASAARAPAAAAAPGRPRVLSITLPMSKPDWSVDDVACEFAPRLEGASELVRFDVPMPCGLVLEDADGEVVVAETLDGSNARAAGLRPGDVLRATSAVRQQMVMPTWQLLGGGIGRPRPFRFIFGTDLAGPPPRAFEDVLAAVASNRDDEQRRPALLVVERPLLTEAAETEATQGATPSEGGA